MTNQERPAEEQVLLDLRAIFEPDRIEPPSKRRRKTIFPAPFEEQVRARLLVEEIHRIQDQNKIELLV